MPSREGLFPFPGASATQTLSTSADEARTAREPAVGEAAVREGKHASQSPPPLRVANGRCTSGRHASADELLARVAGVSGGIMSDAARRRRLRAA
jgi:hypothetical protein